MLDFKFSHDMCTLIWPQLQLWMWHLNFYKVEQYQDTIYTNCHVGRQTEHVCALIQLYKNLNAYLCTNKIEAQIPLKTKVKSIFMYYFFSNWINIWASKAQHSGGSLLLSAKDIPVSCSYREHNQRKRLLQVAATKKRSFCTNKKSY